MVVKKKKKKPFMVSDSKMRNNTNISKLQIPKLSTNLDSETHL